MLKKLLKNKDIINWLNKIREAQNIVICGHRGPDGDAIGSSLALANYLYGLGKNARIIMPNSFASFLKWLPRANYILNYENQTELSNKLIKEADMICCLDFNELSRLDNMTAIVEKSKATFMHIDHHRQPGNFADLQLAVPTASSTCELVFKLIYELGAYESIDSNCATSLYTGMMTDTGGFTYNSNDPEIFIIVSKLLEKGVDKDSIYTRIFHNYSQNRLKLKGYLLYEKMKFYADGQAALLTLNKEEMQKFNFTKGDTEGFVNIPLDVKNTKLSIFLREDTEKDVIRVSLRSVKDFNCNEVAKSHFNGGGHINASGGCLTCSLEKAIEVAKQAFEKYFPSEISKDT